MKRGFTLVELLATIVILAIVSLITIPIITGVINKTRLNSLKSSAYGLLEASNLYIAQYNPDSTIRFDIDNNKVISNDTTHLLKYKGSIKEGTVILSNKGKVTVCITDGKNSAYKNYNENKVTLVEENKCYIPDNTSIVYLDNGATITELSNQELTERVIELASKVEALENSNNEKTTKINALEQQVETLESDNEALKQSVGNINTSLNTINNRIATNTTNITSLTNTVSNIGTYVYKEYNTTVSTSHTSFNVVNLKNILSNGTWIVMVTFTDAGGKADVLIGGYPTLGFISSSEHELYPKGYTTGINYTIPYIGSEDRIISFHVGALYNNESTTVTTRVMAYRIK